MSSSNCCFLTCIQISQEAGQVVWYSHPFQNFPQFAVIHTVTGFGIVNKAEVDVFLELSCFFHNPADVGNLISGSSAISKSNLNIWKFTVHVLLKPGLENFEHDFTSVWWWVQLCGSLSILWHCLSLGLEWKLTFSSPLTTAEFSKFADTLSAALSQHHLLGLEIAQLECHHLSNLTYDSHASTTPLSPWGEALEEALLPGWTCVIQHLQERHRDNVRAPWKCQARREKPVKRSTHYKIPFTEMPSVGRSTETEVAWWLLGEGTGGKWERTAKRYRVSPSVTKMVQNSLW